MSVCASVCVCFYRYVELTVGLNIFSCSYNKLQRRTVWLRSGFKHISAVDSNKILLQLL